MVVVFILSNRFYDIKRIYRNRETHAKNRLDQNSEATL